MKFQSGVEVSRLELGRDNSIRFNGEPKKPMISMNLTIQLNCSVELFKRVETSEVKLRVLKLG